MRVSHVNLKLEFLMKSKILALTARTIAVLALTAGIGAQAQNSEQNALNGASVTTFNGVIDAYSPRTTATSTAPATGPYEIHGPWTLTVDTSSERADFSAAVNMELSDGWALTLNKGDFDPKDRNAHTHHITLVDAHVAQLPNNGLEIYGIATITLNGNPAPVSPSPAVIKITGGADVEYSNITLTFGTPGSKHFGPEPLPGVVQSITQEE